MTVKQAHSGNLEIVLSPTGNRGRHGAVMVNPTASAQSWALEKYFRKSDWIGVARCARNLLKLEARGSRN